MTPSPAWGQMGAPVAPWQLRDLCPFDYAPRGVRSVLGADVRMGELHAGVWEQLPDRGEHVDARRLREAVRTELGPRLQTVGHRAAFPLGMTSAQLRRAPLGSRAFTVLEREGLLDDDERLAGVTVGTLAGLRACGNTTVLEVLCVAEVLCDWPADPPAAKRPGSSVPTAALGALCELAGWAVGERRAETLGELLDLLGEVPDELDATAESLRSLPVAELANQGTVARFDPEQQAATLLARYHERHRLVLRHRLLPASPMTLQELGRELDVTRERVRQLERGVREDLAAHLSGALRRLAARTGTALGTAVRAGPPPEEAQRLVTTLRNAGWGDDAWPLTLFLAGPYVRRGDWWHAEHADGWLRELPDRVLDLCDEHGLVEATEVRQMLHEAGISPRWRGQWLREHVPLELVPGTTLLTRPPAAS